MAATQPGAALASGANWAAAAVTSAAVPRATSAVRHGVYPRRRNAATATGRASNAGSSTGLR